MELLDLSGWLETYTNPRTRLAYHYDLREFATFLVSECSECQLSQRTIDSYMRVLMHRGLCQSSVRRKASALSSYIKYLNNQHGYSRLLKVVAPEFKCNEGMEGRRQLNRPLKPTGNIGLKLENSKRLRDFLLLAILEAKLVRPFEVASIALKGCRFEKGNAFLWLRERRNFIQLPRCLFKEMVRYSDGLLKQGVSRDSPLFGQLRGKCTGRGLTVSTIYQIRTAYMSLASFVNA